MSRGDSAATASGDSEGSDEARRLHNWVRAGRNFSGGERHCFFQNAGAGAFRELSAVSGLDLPDDGRGAAFTDWDRDGDLDLWTANRTGPQLRFLENGKPKPGSSLVLHLQGAQCNRDAIGARVVLRIEGQPPQSRTVTAGSGFLAQSSKAVHFGVGEAAKVEVTVNWPGGEAESHPDLDAGAQYLLVQGKAPAKLAIAAGAPLPAKPAHKLEPTDEMRLFSATRVPLPKLAYSAFSGGAKLVPAKPARPLLINLWASWCEPCAAELAAFAAAKGDLAKAGIDVLALSIDDDAAKAMIANIAFPHPAGHAPPRTVELLQIVNNRLFDRHRELPVPTSFLVAPKGYLAAVYKGVVDPATVIADAAKLSLDRDGFRAASLPFPGRWVSKGLAKFRPFALASELVEEGYFDEAVDYAERTRGELEGDAEFALLLARFGNEQFRRGRGEGAIHFFREALGRDPDLAVAHLNLGITLNRKGDGEPAESALRRAIELEPDNVLAHRELAINLANRDRATEAVPLFRRALVLNPKDMTTSIHLARALVGVDPAEALTRAQAADAATGHKHPNVLAILADAQHATGSTAAAIATAGRALALAKQHNLDDLVVELRGKLAKWR